ncbi:hypothetical protein TRVL_10231 [Trypanosoma vivax]|nr:hypothetical protein TRVL_10231 [Trypanosoma vivax]
MVCSRLPQEPSPGSTQRAALSMGGKQHVGQAGTPCGCGISILVRDRVGVEVGVLERKGPQRVVVTMRFLNHAGHTITSAYIPRKADVFGASTNSLLGVSAPLAERTSASTNHV